MEDHKHSHHSKSPEKAKAAGKKEDLQESLAEKANYHNRCYQRTIT